MAFNKYLRYRLKSTALRSLLLCAASVIITFSFIYEDMHGYSKNNCIGIFVFLLGALATLLPILETAPFKNRRNLDTLYSMPISRRGLAAAHYLGGLIQMLFIFSVTFGTGMIFISAYNETLDLAPLAVFYPAMLVFGWIIYSFFSFLFAEANTVIDGIIISTLWLGAGVILILSVGSLIPNLSSSKVETISYNANVYYPIYEIFKFFRRCIASSEYYGYEPLTAQNWFDLLSGIHMWFFIGGGAAYGYFRTMTRKAAQKAGEITDSPFGYKILIPICAFSLFIISADESSAILAVLTLAAAFIGYIIYRRSFKPRLRDILTTAACLALAFIMFITPYLFFPIAVKANFPEGEAHAGRIYDNEGSDYMGFRKLNLDPEDAAELSRMFKEGSYKSDPFEKGKYSSTSYAVGLYWGDQYQYYTVRYDDYVYIPSNSENNATPKYGWLEGSYEKVREIYERTAEKLSPQFTSKYSIRNDSGKLVREGEAKGKELVSLIDQLDSVTNPNSGYIGPNATGACIELELYDPLNDRTATYRIYSNGCIHRKAATADLYYCYEKPIEGIFETVRDTTYPAWGSDCDAIEFTVAKSKHYKSAAFPELDCVYLVRLDGGKRWRLYLDCDTKEELNNAIDYLKKQEGIDSVKRVK